MDFKPITRDQRLSELEEHNKWHVLALELMASLGDIYGTSSQSRDPEAILKTTTFYIKRVIEFETLAFMTINEADASFELQTCEPAEHRDPLHRQIQIMIENGQFAWAINQNRAITLESEALGRPVILHVLTTKTRVRGMFIGVAPADFASLSVAKLNLLSVILHNCAYSLESAALYQLIQDQNRNLEAVVEKRTRELEYQSGHDTLTGLPNRVLFQDRVNQAIARGLRYHSLSAVLLLDIDLFSRINESMGLAAGDSCLKAIAQRLSSILRQTDAITRPDTAFGNITLSRLGGDEFSVLVTDLKEVDDVTKVVQRIFESLAAPFVINGHQLFITASIGIAIHPHDGEDAALLLKHADVAMLHAKDQGRNNYQFYAKDINSLTYDHLMLESSLRHALENEEFTLFYQPKISIGSGEIIGAEALIRWQTAEGKLISPMDFIPVAEQSGLIVPIGEWVLRTACAQAKAWLDDGLDHPKVAVNLSARQFRDKQLVDKITRILEQTGLPPEYLEVELTESIVMEDVDNNISTLKRIHDLGIRLSIDDFGTGYSSLSYLKRFPIHTVKIDRSFVKDLHDDSDDAAIVTAIIALAHSLKLCVIAEGVESAAHRDFLSGLKCDQAQGYFYSKPLPAPEYLKFVKGRQRPCAG